jgi:hypothetical protein
MKRTICAIVFLALIACSFGCNSQPTTGTSSANTSTTTLTTDGSVTTRITLETVIPVNEYKTFEIKAGDIGFAYFQPPIFKFEYPSIYKLIEKNSWDMLENSGTITSVNFRFQNEDIPESVLGVFIRTPGHDPSPEHDQFHFKNAKEMYEWETINSNMPYLATIITGNMTVSGITAYYVEMHFDANMLEFEHPCIVRQCIFDYAGLIWDIGINCFYLDEEPPIIKEYFEHFIDTFEILN